METQEEPACRVCYDDTTTSRNPLVKPCACVGSVAQIHRLCLLRWVYRDLGAPTLLCELCRVPYSAAEITFHFEQIPVDIGPLPALMRDTLLMTILFQYLNVLCVVAKPIPLSEADLFTCSTRTVAAQHAAYAVLFWRLFEVQHPELYWAAARKRYVTIATAHVLLLVSYSQGALILGFLVCACLGAYWTTHINAKKAINAALYKELDV